MKQVILALLVLSAAWQPAEAQRAPGQFAPGDAHLVGGNFQGSLFVIIPTAVQVEPGYRVELRRQALSDAAPLALLAAEPDCERGQIRWRLDRVAIEGRRIAFEGPVDLGTGWRPFADFSGVETQRLLGFLCGDQAARAAVVRLPRRMSTRLVSQRFQALSDAGLTPAAIQRLAALDADTAIEDIAGLTEADIVAARGTVEDVRERARAVFTPVED